MEEYKPIQNFEVGDIVIQQNSTTKLKVLRFEYDKKRVKTIAHMGVVETNTSFIIICDKDNRKFKKVG